MNKNIVIEAKNVGKIYQEGKIKVEVLNDVNLKITQGEQVAIIGASGSGKSTLLHLLGGLDNYTSGSIRVDGETLAKLSEKKLSHIRNKKLGFVYQLHHLLPEFTLLENVCMPLLIRGISIVEAKNRAYDIIEKVGLSHRLQHKIGELSGGEKQRTAIARALVTNPLCVLADEPTGNLDNKTAEKVYDTLLEINRAYKTSLVIVTHDLHLASRMDRVLKLENKILTENV